MEDLEKKCRWYESAREQRISEVEKGWNYEGTAGYEKRGCYRCTGYDDSCKSYMTRKKYDR